MFTRDFIYMDTERVRSLFAQIEQGVIETASKEIGAEQKTEAHVEGGIPWFTKAAVAGGAIWNRKESETRTLHDHMFNYVEQKLSGSNSLLDINATFTSQDWVREDFAKFADPASFVRVKGSVRVNDFGQMASLMKDYHELARIISSFAASGQAEGRSKHAQQQLQDKILQQMGFTDKKKLFEDMAKIITRFYEHSIVLKMWPFEKVADCAFSCWLNEQYLRDSIRDLNYKYGATPQDPWILVGQVAKITRSGEQQVSSPATVKDDFEKSVEQMFDAARFFFNVGAVKYPYISITPLALYRE